MQILSLPRLYNTKPVLSTAKVVEMDETKYVLTVEEARQILRLGRSGIYEAIKMGELPTLRFGRRIVIPRAALEKLLAEAAGPRL